METFYKNKKTADYFNGFCGERGILYHLQHNHHIGFRIEPRASLYLRQVMEDLVASGLL